MRAQASVSYTHLDVYKRQSRDFAEGDTMKITVRSDGFEGYKKRALARAAKLGRRDVYKRQQAGAGAVARSGWSPRLI